MFSLLQKFLLADLFKARHGIYADTAENRRLHRVGQEYGHAAQQKQGGEGRKPAQQDDEQKNPLAAKLDSLSPTQLSKLVDTTEKRIQEFRSKGYEQGVQKLEEIAREAKKRLMGDEAYKKQQAEQKEKEAKKPLEDIESIMEGISDKFFDGKVSAKEKRTYIENYIGEGEYDRLWQKLASRQFDSSTDKNNAFMEEVYEALMNKQSAQGKPEVKTPTKEGGKPEEEEWRWNERENEVGNKVSALGGKLVQAIRDGGDTKGVEGEISEALKEASDKQLRSTVNSLNSIRKRNKTKANEIALKLTQQEIDRRKRESGMFGGMADEDSEKPKKKPKADKKPEDEGDDVKVEARMTFNDIPMSGKVNMTKYLSDKRRNKVDEDFKSIRNLDSDTIQTLHDGLVNKFNEEFDSMSKADRAEALYKIARVKNELQKK